MTTATQTQIRRDTATNLNAATPASGELGYDTTNKRLAVGDGSTAGGTKIPNAKDVQNQVFTYPTVGGTGDAITLTNTPAATSYSAGQKFTFKAAASNTTAVTANADGLGAKNVKKMSNGALASLAASDIVSGGVYDVFYDGTQFQIKGLAEGPFSAGSLKFLGSATASVSATIDLTSLLSSTYDDYLITLENVLPSLGSNSLLMRFSTDNSTFDAGSNYNCNQVLSQSSSVTGSSAPSATSASMGGGAIGVVSTLSGVSGNIYLYNVNNTAVYRQFTALLAFAVAGGAPATVTATGQWLNTTNALEAVRFLVSSGSITSGTFRVYGLAKS